MKTKTFLVAALLILSLAAVAVYAQQQPDLIVKTLKIEPRELEAGNQVNITTRVYNQGEADTEGPVKVVVKYGDGNVERLFTPRKLRAGRGYRFNLVHAYEEAGVYRVIVKVDSNNKVIESDETNNRKIKRVWVNPEKTCESEPPGLPLTLWGAVRINDEPVPDGTQITAWIDGSQVSQTETFSPGTYVSVYTFDIPADDFCKSGKDGGVSGDIVSFKIGEVAADQTISWKSGVVTELNLSTNQ